MKAAYFVYLSSSILFAGHCDIFYGPVMLPFISDLLERHHIEDRAASTSPWKTILVPKGEIFCPSISFPGCRNHSRKGILIKERIVHLRSSWLVLV